MDVLFLAPAYPLEMQQFVRGLAEAGARVFGVGDSPTGSLPASLRAHLHDYLQVPGILDEDDVIRRVKAWLGGHVPDRVESNWEMVIPLVARLREELGSPGMSVDTVLGFRDKAVMNARVAAAGLRVAHSIKIRSQREAWAAAERIGFPLIFKPTMGAGSTDTWRCDHARELDRVLQLTRHVPEATIQEFVVGQEFTYETICVDGVPRVESVTKYLPNVLEARKNEWISPIIASVRDLSRADVAPGVALGRKVLRTLGMGTGFTHMEWYLKDNGEAVFGEIACRAPGANMVDLMNYAADDDHFREWGRAVVRGQVRLPEVQPWHAAIVFKRAKGQGRIAGYTGLDEFVAKYRPHIARVDLLPVGANRRDWTQTFLGDGNLVVRHRDWESAVSMAKEAAGTIAIWAK